MEFLFLTLGYHPDIDGGGYRYAAEVAEALARRGHAVSVITKSPGAEFAAEEIRNDVRILRIERLPRSLGVGSWTAVNRRCQDLLRREAPGSSREVAVVSHNAYFAPALRKWAGRYGVFFHGPWGLEHRFACRGKKRPWWRKILDRVASRRMHFTEGNYLGRATCVWTASRYMAEQMRVWHAGKVGNAASIGGGANLSRFDPGASRQHARARWSIESSARIFLAVRRLDARMGLLELVEGFLRVAARDPKTELWIAGRGELKGAIERRAAESAAGKRVRLLGFVPEEDLPDLYRCADAVWMPSLDLEGFGLVTAEAMACGTPVLASNAGANAEVVGPFRTDLLFEAGSVEAIAATMAKVMTGQLPLPSREETASYARSHFRWERPAEAMEAKFRCLATGERSE